MKNQINEILLGLDFGWKAQFHILKHFVTIDETYRKLLLINGFSHDQIVQQLKTVGSVFDKSFSNNPQELLTTLINNKRFITSINETKFTKEIQFSIESIYDDGVGFDNLISLAELTSNQKNTLYKRQIGDELFFHISTPFKRTNIVNMIVAKLEKGYSIITIFPGTYAPQFPNEKKQNKLEYKVSVDFWNKHAFITAGL